MELILTGGGDSEHFQEIDQVFIEALPPGARLLFIPLAGEEKDWTNGLERIEETFSTIEFGHIEMCLNLSALDWKTLQHFHAIYIDGGNTFRLMNRIRRTHFYELIHRFLYHGGLVNGDSAGAIILGSHLETAHFGDFGDQNESGIISYQGLNLLGSYAIHCHYEDSEDLEIQEFTQGYGFPVIALHENSAAYINGLELTVVGENKVTIFKDDQIFHVYPGEKVVLGQSFMLTR